MSSEEFKSAGTTPGAACQENSHARRGCRSVQFADLDPNSAQTQQALSPSFYDAEGGTIRLRHLVHDELIQSSSQFPASDCSDMADLNLLKGTRVPLPTSAASMESEPSMGLLAVEGRIPGAANTKAETGGVSSSPSSVLPSSALATAVASRAAAPVIGSNHGIDTCSSSTAKDSHQQNAQSESDDFCPLLPGQLKKILQGQRNISGGIHQMNEPGQEGQADESTALRLPGPVLTSPGMGTAAARQQGRKMQATAAEPLHTTSVGEGYVTCKRSLAIVPYVGSQPLQCQPFNFMFKEQRDPPFDPVPIPLHVLLRERSTPELLARTNINSSLAGCLNEKGRHTNPANSRLLCGTKVSRMNRDQEQQSWVVVSAQQAEQAAGKLRDEVAKNKALESTVKRHKRERVLIYDAAMKQAAKNEKEGVNEAKKTFERQQVAMRSDVDQELRKINDLYQERCRDYAQMVSDECEGEVSKACADLRKDWARQKKTIAQLVRDGGKDDRQVAVIARAVMEQLQEERKNELAIIRADIYADVKMEFESREVALREALQSEFQADLDGQLLISEIRHQKEVDQLRLELGGGEPSSKVAAGSLVVYSSETPQGQPEGASGPSSTRRPSRSRRPLQQKACMSMATGGNRGAAGAGRVLTPSGKPALVTKIPAFKSPVQKVSLGENKIADKPSSRSASNATFKPGTWTKTSSRTPSIRGSASSAMGNAAAQESLSHDDAPLPRCNEDNERDGGITSALMVSPTKAIPGMVVTPSTETEDGSCVEPPRPKKRAKRLFSASF